MPIDLFASERHFVDHLAPVWAALPSPARGRFVVPPHLVDHAQSVGLDPVTEWGRAQPVLVASYGDLRAVRRVGRSRIAFLEHGSGQSWANGYFGPPRSRLEDHPSHPGGWDRGDVSLFLHPNEHAAARERAAYPKARVEVIGCPKLDDLPKRQPGPGPVVAISFHWNSPVAPEARGSFRFYRRVLPKLARTFTVIGHGHPKGLDRLAHHFARAHIPVVTDFRDVCRQADLYLTDSSSTLFEFASTGRPVVTLNAPWYSRGRNHGLRFWEAASVGLQVDRPAALIETVRAALKDPAAQRRRREAALDIVYAYRSGAAQRAADVLVEWMRSRSRVKAA